MALDLEPLEARARQAYERSRWSNAALACAPFVVLVALVALAGHQPVISVLLGLGLYGAGVVLLWRGQELGSGVLPGALAGLVPLTLALCTRACGHVCMGGACMSLCMPACFAGGAVAGLMLTFVAARKGAGIPFWVASSGMAVLTGALGCSCIGFGGVVGLVAGLGMPVGAGVVRVMAEKRA